MTEQELKDRIEKLEHDLADARENCSAALRALKPLVIECDELKAKLRGLQ